MLVKKESAFLSKLAFRCLKLLNNNSVLRSVGKRSSLVICLLGPDRSIFKVL